MKRTSPHSPRSLLQTTLISGSFWEPTNLTCSSLSRQLEKEMATHSSVLAWRIPGIGEPGGLLSVGSHRVGHDWSHLAAEVSIIMWAYSLQSLSVYTQTSFWSSLENTNTGGILFAQDCLVAQEQKAYQGNLNKGDLLLTGIEPLRINYQEIILIFSSTLFKTNSL